MSNTLSPNPKVWTKWHQERVQNHEMDRDVSNLPNQRYIQIIKDTMDQQYQPKLIEWAMTIGENHKKGLHVIKSVVDVKGAKRFKKPPNGDGSMDLTTTLQGSATDLASLDISNFAHAKDFFRKKQVTTSYANNFGDKPQAGKDTGILKEKAFKNLPIAQILKPNVREMMNRWLTINDQDKFTERIFFTVREMYTVVKAKMTDIPTSQDIHATHMELRAERPRFDKMLKDIDKMKRANARSQIRVNPQNQRRNRNYFETTGMSDFKIGSRHRDMTPQRLGALCITEGSPTFDAKKFKLDFLRGDKEVMLY